MRTGRPRKFDLTLTENEHAQLSAIVGSRAIPHGLVQRAKIILRSVAGESNTTIAAKLGVSIPHDRALAETLPPRRSGGAL